MKRQPSEWEKIIANETTDNGLISKIYKQLIQLSTRKTNNPIKEWGKDLNRHFSKEGTDGRQIHEKMLSIAHCQRNADQNYNEISPHIGQNGHHQKSTNNKCWRECGERKHSYTVGGTVN